MKKTIITLLAALLLLPATVSAQYWLIINKGENIKKDSVMIWDIESISFEEIAPRTLPKGAPNPTAVNLGLSVEWANINLGATSPTDAGWLVGWGDVTGWNKSQDPKWYPVAQPTGDIVGFGNDIIKKYWSSDDDVWRLPTDEELQELIDDCTWEWVDGQEGTGFNVTGTNGNSIFLPAAGSRDGEEESGVGTALYYWSGTLNMADNSKANAMMFTSGNGAKPTVGALKRYIGCALRAVYGEPKINVTVSSSEAYNLGVSSATIKVELGGTYDNYLGLRCGLVYGTSQDLQNDNSRSQTPTQSCSGGYCEITLTGLTPEVTYWYCAFVEVNGQRIYQQAESRNLKTTLFPEPEIVDLGLTVKWASFNIGATSPTERGLYIGWGDATGTHTSHNLNDYGFNSNTMDIGFNPEYDTAYAIWQKKWRMPTRSEFKELYEKTTVSYEVIGSVGCYKFTGANGKYIYLPITGLYTQYSSGLTDYRQSQYGWYWTSECSQSREPYLVSLYSTSNPDIQTSIMWYRMPIRAVYEEKSSYQGDESGNGSGSGSGSSEDDNESGEGGNSGESQVTPQPGAGNAVDLGLSVKWADCNIGSSSTSSSGYFFSWGCDSVQAGYGLTDYKFYDQDNGFNGFTYIGTLSDQRATYSIAGTKYDAARQLWGGKWRMPTRADFTELETECNWSWVTQNGISGYLVTSKKYPSRSIFLPASGRMQNNPASLSKEGDNGYYWTSEIYADDDAHRNMWVHTFEFSDSFYKLTFNDRYIGLQIRPVQE